MTAHEAAAFLSAPGAGLVESQTWIAVTSVIGLLSALVEASFMVLAGLSLQHRTLSWKLQSAVFAIPLLLAVILALIADPGAVLALDPSSTRSAWLIITPRELLSAGGLLYFAWMFAARHPRAGTAAGLTTAAFCMLHAAHRMGFALTAAGLPVYSSLYSAPIAIIDTTLVFGLSIGLIASVVEDAHLTGAQIESTWEASGEGMLTVDTKGVIVRANSAFCRMIGKPADSIIGQPVSTCYSDMEGAGTRRLVILWNGRHLWLDVSSSVVETPAGKATFSILRDVTREVETEQALEQSRQRMMIAFESTDDAVFEWKISAGELFLAPKILAALGYRAAEVSQDYRELCSPEDRVKLDASLAIALTTPGHRFELEHRMTNSAGETVWILARGSVLEVGPDGTARRVAGTLRDISRHRRSEQERERLRLELMQAQKLEAIGHLASGVAHDFNNLLTVILASGAAIETMPDDPAFVQDCGREIREACERASHLTSRLLAFSRKQVSQPRPLDLNEVLRDSERMLRRLIGEDVSVCYSYGDINDHVIADPREIDQIVLNLAVNARDAMPDGGTLTLKTDVVTLAESKFPLPPGMYVTLTVSDTGHGMDESVRARIFEPFFTTKEVGKGTGLGLSTVLWIVKDLNGAVDVASRPGEGASFTLYLPAVRATADTEPVPEIVPDVRGDESILLVEDQDDVRRVLAGRLRSYGYHVIPASGGADALETVRNLDVPLHVLVTDVVMGDCRGPDLANAIARLQPGIRTLYMSGYADREVARVADAAYIQKPFTADQLAAQIRQILSAAPSNSRKHAAHG